MSIKQLRVDIYLKDKVTAPFQWRLSRNSLLFLEESPPPPTDLVVQVGTQAPAENEFHLHIFSI